MMVGIPFPYSEFVDLAVAVVAAAVANGSAVLPVADVLPAVVELEPAVAVPA